MNDDMEKQFWTWADANKVARPELAQLLGVDERSVSNYRGRGLPKKKIPLALKIMSDWGKVESVEQDNRLNITFTDAEMEDVEQAAALSGAPVREYCRRAVIARARMDKASEDKGKAAS